MAIVMPQLLGMGGGPSSRPEVQPDQQTEFDTFLWVIEQLRGELQEFVNDRIVKVLIDETLTCGMEFTRNSSLEN